MPRCERRGSHVGIAAPQRSRPLATVGPDHLVARVGRRETARVTIGTAFTRMFNCRVPIQQAGMGGFTSPDLAIAVAQAGGVGMLTGTIGHDALSSQLDLIPAGMTVGVNFLVPFIDALALEDACNRSRFVEFFWGWPDPRLVEQAHAGGALVGWQVGSADEARAARDVGCEVVIAQGIEAGGHVRGTVGLLPLLDEVRPVVELPLVAAGGIGTGHTMAAAMTAGADAVRLGTRFLASTESIAHPEYVDALISASAGDTFVTTAFSDGWPDAPHRVLRAAVASGEALGRTQSWGPDWPTVGSAGPVDARALYAGQSVGAVRSRQPAADIIAELVDEAEPLLATTSRVTIQ
jgi:nitronate monooxygenase